MLPGLSLFVFGLLPYALALGTLNLPAVRDGSASYCSCLSLIERLWRGGFIGCLLYPNHALLFTQQSFLDITVYIFRLRDTTNRR